MACKFSCFLNFSDALKENDVGVFQSDKGEQYRVKYRSNVCRDLLLKIEWTIPKQVLFTVKLYNTTFKRCFSSKGIVVNGKKTFMKLRGAFNISNFRDYKVLCVITLIPYIKFNEHSEFPSGSRDSGFTEHESQQLSMDESSTFIDEETKFKDEDTEKSIDIGNNFDVNAYEMTEPDECKISTPIKKNGFSSESDIMLDEGALTNAINKVSTTENSNNFTSDGIKTGMSLLVMNNNSENSCGQSNKTKSGNDINELSEGYLSSGQILENKKDILESNIIEGSKVKLTEINVNKSEPINSYIEINALAESKSQDLVNDEVIKTVELGEENIRNMDQNIDIVPETKVLFVENNPAMEVDFAELSPEDNSVYAEENDLSSNKDPKNIEVDLSSNIAPEINPEPEVELHASPENDGKGVSPIVDVAVINTADMEVNLVLESNDFDKKNNETLEKDLTSLSDNNNPTLTLNSEPLEIHNNKDVQLPVVEGKSPSINIQETSEVNKVVEKDNEVIDKTMSASPNLPSAKTGLVFKTLVRKLSADEHENELANVKSKVTSGSKIKKKSTKKSNISKAKTFPIMESEFKGLSMDMLDLLTSGDLADAVITNGDKHIKVHRAIVSARSSVLKETFTEHMQDDINYRAVVDIPTCFLEDIIIFLYVGLIYIKSTKMGKDLHQIAERYCINDLIDICSKYVSK